MTAVCQSGWDWASNSFDQNPCAIAGALEAPCRGLVSYTLGPLNKTNYVAPPKGSALPCECNTVMYSLFMACTACQGEQTQSWTFWDQYCDAVFITQYPLEIPSDTAIPAWAYLNVTMANMWDPTLSRDVVDLPESTGSGPPGSTIGPSSTRTGTGPLNSSNGGGGGSHVGAIVGGVVGSLAALGIIAALAVWFVVRSKRSKVAPSSAFINSRSSHEPYPDYESPPPPPSPGPFGPPRMMYDASSRSAFPPTFHDPSSGSTTGYPQPSYDPHSQRRGQYRGAAEV